MSSTPSSLQIYLIISPISLFTAPYIAFRRYLGINTMWYVQLYFECAKLTSSIADPRFLFGRLPAHHIVKRGFAFYYSGDRYCLFRSPRLWRGINGIFIYQKEILIEKLKSILLLFFKMFHVKHFHFIPMSIIFSYFSSKYTIDIIKSKLYKYSPIKETLIQGIFCWFSMINALPFIEVGSWK